MAGEVAWKFRITGQMYHQRRRKCRDLSGTGLEAQGAEGGECAAEGGLQLISPWTMPSSRMVAKGNS